MTHHTCQLSAAAVQPLFEVRDNQPLATAQPFTPDYCPKYQVSFLNRTAHRLPLPCRDDGVTDDGSGWVCPVCQDPYDKEIIEGDLLGIINGAISCIHAMAL